MEAMARHSSPPPNFWRRPGVAGEFGGKKWLDDG